MYRIFAVFFFFLPIIILAQSQNNIGDVQIIQDDRVVELVEKHIAINKKFKKNGYRIQIFFDSGNNSKNGAYKAKTDFLMQHPNVETYVIFESPFYKVRIGNFRSRLEAQSFLNNISSQYSNAFIVKDIIDYPDNN